MNILNIFSFWTSFSWSPEHPSTQIQICHFLEPLKVIHNLLKIFIPSLYLNIIWIQIKVKLTEVCLTLLKYIKSKLSKLSYTYIYFLNISLQHMCSSVILAIATLLAGCWWATRIPWRCFLWQQNMEDFQIWSIKWFKLDCRMVLLLPSHCLVAVYCKGLI